MESCDRAPKAPIRPTLDGRRGGNDWRDAGRVACGSVRNAQSDRPPCASLLYGVNSDNFYLRFEFDHTSPLRRDPSTEIHLLWFYPGVTMYNSPAPLANLPSTAPLNYLFHHHLGLRLADLSCWFEEANERYEWQPRQCQANVILADCLDIAVPWSSFPGQADYPLRLVVVLADAGKFQSYLPTGQLINLQARWTGADSGDHELYC
ncbi:MAG: hypothetical protein HC838_08010 [Spirulinaceae cyanobacterium RM2_2_10]|nr:hypothetical protein [Spirulinaceae cyanobacterium SM2_1_0]NJO20003.1 hypothetical protein [Spirulinaceae cyanobacterium RM2_2_10]